jgi:hypothetical protein
MSEQKKGLIAKDYYRYFPVGMLMVVVACAAFAL